MGKKNAYGVLVGKLLARCPSKRQRRLWEHIIKIKVITLVVDLQVFSLITVLPVLAYCPF
jgi:hypothetical protein